MLSPIAADFGAFSPDMKRALDLFATGERERALLLALKRYRSTAQRIRDALHDLLLKIKRALGSKELRLSGNQKTAFRDLSGKVSEMETLFAKALETTQEKAGSKNAANEGGEGKFSIKMLDDGRYYVKSDRQVLSGNDPKQWGKQLQNYINSEIRKGHDIVLPTTDGNLVRITERSAYKLADDKTTTLKTHKKTKLSDANYRLKEEAASHIDEIVLTGEFSHNQEDIGGHHENDIGEDGFNTYTAYFEDKNGKYYYLEFTSALNGDSETAYSIGNIRERKKPTSGRGSSARESSALNGSKLSNENVAQSLSGVKTGFSVGRDDSGVEFYDSKPKYSMKVSDKDTLKFLDNQKTVTTYKTMQLIDGIIPYIMARIMHEKVNTMADEHSPPVQTIVQGGYFWKNLLLFQMSRIIIKRAMRNKCFIT